MQLPSPNPKVNLLFSKETIMLGRSETFGIYWRGGFLFHGVQRDAFLAVLVGRFSLSFHVVEQKIMKILKIWIEKLSKSSSPRLDAINL